jgi:hypothetical protein
MDTIKEIKFDANRIYMKKICIEILLPHHNRCSITCISFQ